MRWRVVMAMIAGLAAPLLAIADDACLGKIEPVNRLAKGHWKGDWSETLDPGAGHPELQFTLHWEGDLEFTLSNETEEIWPLPPPPTPDVCDEWEKKGTHHPMCTPEYADEAANASHTVDIDGSLKAFGTATGNFRMDLASAAVLTHGATGTPVHARLKGDVHAGDLSGLWFERGSNETFDANVTTATPFADAQSKIRARDGQVSAETTGHVHAGTTRAEVHSKSGSEIPAQIDANAKGWELIVRTRSCGIAVGTVQFLAKFPVVSSNWKANHDEYDAAFEQDVRDFVAAPIPQTVTETYVKAADATYQKFLGNGSDYRACVAEIAYQKANQIRAAWVIRKMESDFKAKVATATEGEQICQADAALLANLRYLELMGLPEDCSLSGDAMKEMLDAAEAFHKRIGKWPAC